MKTDPEIIEFESPFPMDLAHTLHQRKLPDGSMEYRWKRGDGKWSSPTFTDAKQAADFRGFELQPE